MEGMSCALAEQQPVGLPLGQLSASPAGRVWLWILAEYREPQAGFSDSHSPWT